MNTDADLFFRPDAPAPLRLTGPEAVELLEQLTRAAEHDREEARRIRRAPDSDGYIAEDVKDAEEAALRSEGFVEIIRERLK